MLNNQFSSSQINETLLNAMKTIAQKEVQNLEFDVTEKYTILEKTKDKQGEVCYIIEANGSKWEVYSTDKTEYYKNDVVLVNIPKNILTEKKYIIGLANQPIEKYFLPNSNFVPVIKKRIAIPIIQNGYKKGFCIFDRSKYKEQFQISDSIYLKFDIKTLVEIDYDYEFQIHITYLSGRKDTYYFSNDLFTGNLNNLYYSTQDIVFSDIPNFKDIQIIQLTFNSPIIQQGSSAPFRQIILRNLELAIGKFIPLTKTGIDIISKESSLTYNNEKNDFSRELGIIWYNRNDNGDFIGFDTDLEVPIIDGQINWKQIVADEYQYATEKNAFDKKKEYYDTEVCPYDIKGLQYIQDIDAGEKILQRIIEIFIKKSNFMGEFIENFEISYNEIINNIASPEKVSNSDLNYNIILQIMEDLQNAYKNFKNNCLTWQEAHFGDSQTINNLYFIWSNYMGQLFLNVRHMQELQLLELSNLKLSELKPTAFNNKELNFADIVNKINDFQKTDNDLYQPDHFYESYIELKQVLDNYLSLFQEAINLSEGYKEKLNQHLDTLTTLTTTLYNISMKECYSEINLLVKENFNENLSYWKNVNLINFSETEQNPYYNQYYIKYQEYLQQNSRPQDYSIIDEDQIFNPEFQFSQDVEGQDTIALYWYKEDLNNDQEDLLLKEKYWSLMSSLRIDNTYKNYFPTLYQKNNKYYFNKSTPYANMISVTLPSNLPTITFKVILYYNHKLQGEAEITFTNVQYEDIGFENSLLDLDYVTDQRSIINNTDLKVSATIYNNTNAREIVTPKVILFTEKEEKPTMFPSLTIQQQGVFKLTHSYSLRNSDSEFIINNNDLRPEFVPYGVLAFSAWYDTEMTATSYLPLSWCIGSPEISLQGAKMLMIKKSGEYEFDQYVTSKTQSKPYKLLGVSNIQISKCEILYYNVIGEATNGQKNNHKGNALKLSESTNGEYFLSFDVTKIRDCLKHYRPVLKIEGTFGEENKSFTFYQSLFILHESYNYVTNKFTDEVEVQSQSFYIFIDPREENLINDIAAQTQNGEGYEFFGPRGTITNNELDVVLNEMQRILITGDKNIIEAYEYYFSIVKTIPKKEWYISIFNDLKTGTITLDTNETMYVYSPNDGRNKSITQSIGDWLTRLFTSLQNFYREHEDDVATYKSALPLTYSDIETLKKLLEEVE